MVLVVKDEFFALHEHAAAATAGVEHPAFVGFEHFNQEFYHAGGGVELPALFPFGHGKFSKEIFIHAAQHILALGLLCAQGGRTYQVDKTAQAGLVEFFLGKYFSVSKKNRQYDQ